MLQVWFIAHHLLPKWSRTWHIVDRVGWKWVSDGMIFLPLSWDLLLLVFGVMASSSNIPPWQALGSNCSISILNNWDTSKWNSEIWFKASKAPLGIVSPCWSDLWAMHKAVRKAFKGVSSILTIQRSIVAQGGGREAQPLSIQKLDQGATTVS